MSSCAPLSIRPLTPADLPAVLAIERRSQPDPWSEGMFLAELDNLCARLTLCLADEEIVGFLCSWLVGGELSILNLATAPAWRRRGVAALLLQDCLDRATETGVDQAWLEVRVGNAGAISLYRRFGFAEVGRRKKYYPDGEDALVMQRLGPPVCVH